MKYISTFLTGTVVIGVFMAISASGLSQESKPAQPQDSKTNQLDNLKDQNKKSDSSASVPVYIPPTRGAPGGRVGAATRGPQREVFVLAVLAPDQGGLTTSEQPSLYWFISKSTSLAVEFTVTDSQNVEPILETRLPSPITAGVHQIRISDFNIHLAPGAAYQWFVSIVPDAGRRSKDIMTGGIIERVEMPEALKGKIAQAAKSDLPSLYAEAGLWYETIAAISELIDAAPQDQTLRNQRTALLAQVGITGITE